MARCDIACKTAARNDEKNRQQVPRVDFRLPEYELVRRDGQYELRFEGLWTETTMWEIPALAIINELRARAAMRFMSRFDLDVLYALLGR